MGNERYHYDVYDNTVGSIIYINLTREELIEKISIPSDKISEYAKKGYAFARRYIIKPRLIEVNTPKDKTTHLTARQLKFMSDWEKMRQARSVLENGGHIVVKHKGLGYERFVEGRR